jgi:hypothetical protein
MNRPAVEDRYRAIVKEGGALFVGLQETSREGKTLVLFQAEPGASTLSLYTTACNSAEDVRMALKSRRERDAAVKVDGIG